MLHPPGSVQKGLRSPSTLLSKSQEEAELTFRAFPGVADAIRRNSLLTCAVGGGLKYKLQGPVNFLEGAVAGTRLRLWGNPAGGVQERC